MQTFGLIGASGYIAERHYKAIYENGGLVTHIYDIHNSAGAIDKYFPNAFYCRSAAGFFKSKTDYKVICTPNHLHREHILKASVNSKVICEKPLVISAESLSQVPNDTYCILQLRHNPIVEDLKKLKGIAYLEYCVIRGDWYNKSWKGDNYQSGGIAFNIGIHLFDLLIFCYGCPSSFDITHKSNNCIKGYVEFEQIKVVFNLAVTNTGEPRREIQHNNQVYNLSKGFTNAHSISYKHILDGKGWTAKDCYESIALAEIFSSI